ncbi:MAG: DUF58 domain-containing protein [Clostridiales bacterium]|jgi:uncharacterized protein (DUF58 family)|nr:DUF58 domain-containing protein [Clostridiales bacterium]
MIKNRIFYAFLAAISFVLVYFDNTRTAYAMLYSVLLLPVASILMAVLSLWALQVTDSVDKELILKGEETKYRINIKNMSFLYNPGVTLTFPKSRLGLSSTARATTFSISSHEERELSFILSCKYRGVYDIGLESVQTKDFLGLFSLKKRWKGKRQLVVYPRVIELDNLPLSLNLMNKSYSRYAMREEDYSAISDVRPYEPNDSMKRIHWKLSAKRNFLIVKNFETSALNSTAIFIDSGKMEGTPPDIVAAEDKLIEIAVAAGYWCLKKQIPVDMHYSVRRFVSAANIMDFDKIYSLAAFLEFQYDSQIADMLLPFLNEKTNPLNILVLASTLTDEFFDIMARLHHFGHHVILGYVSSSRESGKNREIFSMLLDMGLLCMNIDIGDDINDYF